MIRDVTLFEIHQNEISLDPQIVNLFDLSEVVALLLGGTGVVFSLV